MASRKSKGYSKKVLEIRKLNWPEVTDEMIWDSNKDKGYKTTPRTMPYFQKIMDEIADKGKPVSNTYFALWCRAFDEFVIKINNPKEMAFEAGFTGQRAVYTWKERMRKLKEIGFIKLASVYDEFSYVLIPNPYLVIEKILSNKKYNISNELKNSLQLRKIEIGAI